MNPTDQTITGTAAFLGPGSGTTAAAPVVLELDDGRTGSSFDYLIPPSSAQRFTTSNPPGGLTVGSVRATPNSGNAAPSGLVVFSFAQGGKTVSEAGVPALPTGSAFRVYVEAAGMPGQAGSIRSGLAITNAGVATNTVTLEVTNLDGSLAVPPATLAIPPSGHLARFVDEIFTLPDNFSGVLRGQIQRRGRNRWIEIASQRKQRAEDDDNSSIERDGSVYLGGQILRASRGLGGLVHTVHPVQRDGRPDRVRNTQSY